MSNQLHSVLRFRQAGPIVQLQPFRGQDIDGDTLSIDLAKGSISVQKQVGTTKHARHIVSLPCWHAVINTLILIRSKCTAGVLRTIRCDQKDAVLSYTGQAGQEVRHCIWHCWPGAAGVRFCAGAHPCWRECE
jgi:hypothetical protein